MQTNMFCHGPPYSPSSKQIGAKSHLIFVKIPMSGIEVIFSMNKRG